VCSTTAAAEGPLKETNVTRSFEFNRLLVSLKGHDRATYQLARFYAVEDEEIIFFAGVGDVLDAETLNAEALSLYLLAVARGYQNPHV
jgi:TPR repeat protein